MEALLIDEVMPSYQRRISHSGVFCAPPAQCLDAAIHLDVMRSRVVGALVAARSLPEGGQPIRTLRIADMTEPPLSWLELGNGPAVRLCWARSPGPGSAAGSGFSPQTRRSSGISINPDTPRSH